MLRHCVLAVCCSLSFVSGHLAGQEPASPGPANAPAKAPAPADATHGHERRDELFRKLMTNVRLSGQFTVEGGKEDALHKDDYVISSAVKLGNGDLWLLTSRIRYGTVDLTVPVPVAVRWAGDTPVISLDDVSIPGLGTFSARIVLDRGKYAGTWTHDDKGGHMFGTIRPIADEAAEATPAPASGKPAAPSTDSPGKSSR